MKIIAFLLFAAITTSKASLAQAVNDTVQWLTEASLDLRTTNPDLKIQETLFKEILRDVKMVLAGEATHGTKEFAEIKHRLFRHLVEELDFRYFLIEADFAAGLSVDQYICGDGGNPVEVLKGLRYFHIANKEGLALITWMKSYNETQSADDKIRFFGIDCQASEKAFTELKDYFLAVDPAFYRETKGITLKNHKPGGGMGVLDRKYPVLTLSADTIQIFKARLTANKARYIEASSETQYKIALRLAEVLSQSFEISTGDDGYRKREESMAANVDWILDEIAPVNEKAFLWAHNLHVIYSEVTDRRTDASFGTLGSIIRKEINGKVYSIGLDFNRGSFIANEVKYDTIIKKVWTLDDVPANEFPNLLSKTGMNVLFMDFNSIQNKNLGSWLNGNALKGHGIGGVYYPTYRLRRYIWPENFDGLIFINETHEITLDF